MKRRNSDKQENTRKVQIFRDNKFQTLSWQDLKVGELVKITKDEFFPADIMILSTSDKKGICFIETKNLDGETNLKRKIANKEIQVCLD